MAIAFVQSPGAILTAGSTINPTAAYGSNVTAGNFMIAGIDLGVNGTTVASIADSHSNVWTKAISIAGTNPAEIWWAPVTTGGANTVTLTLSIAETNTLIAPYEFSGIAAATPVDQTTSTSSTGGTPTSGNITTLNANDLLFGVSNSQNGNTAGEAGWTSDAGFDFEYKIVSATGTYAATWTQATGAGLYECVIASFKATAAAASTQEQVYHTPFGVSMAIVGAGSNPY